MKRKQDSSSIKSTNKENAPPTKRSKKIIVSKKNEKKEDNSTESYEQQISNLQITAENEKQAILQELSQAEYRAEDQKLLAEKLQQQSLLEAKQAIASKQGEIGGLELKLKAIESEIEQNWQNYKEFSQSILSEHQAASVLLNERCEQASQQLEVKQKEIDALQDRVRSLESKLNQNQQNHNEFNEAVQKEHCAVLVWYQERGKLQQQSLLEAKQAIASKQSEIDGLELKLRDLGSELKWIKQNHEAFSQTIHTLDEKFEQASEQVILKQKEIDSLVVKLQLSEEKTNRVQQQSDILERQLNLSYLANQGLQERVKFLNTELLEFQLQRKENTLEQGVSEVASANNGNAEEEFLLLNEGNFDQISANINELCNKDSGNANQQTTERSWPRFGTQSYSSPFSPSFFDMKLPEERPDCLMDDYFSRAL